MVESVHGRNGRHHYRRASAVAEKPSPALGFLYLDHL